MIKSQFKTIGASPQQKNTKSFKLTINDIHMLTQFSSKQHFFIVKSHISDKTWVSPVFYMKLPQVWETEIDSYTVTLQLFQKTDKGNCSISKCTVCQGPGLINMQQTSNPKIKVCQIKSFIDSFVTDIKPQKANYYQYNSNIFDSFINQNDISRVQQVNNNKQKYNQRSFQRVAFHGYVDDTSYISEYQPKSIIHKKNFSQIGKKPQQKQKQKFDYELFDDQRNRFQGHLNDSISFIQQLIKNMPEQQNQNKVLKQQSLSKVQQQNNQSQQQYTTAQRWYTDKYKKKNQLKKKISNFQRQKQHCPQPENSVNAINTKILNNQFADKDDILRQIYDISTDSSNCPKQIDFSVNKGTQTIPISSISRKDQQPAQKWNTVIQLPKQGTIFVKCLTSSGELNGCIGMNQIKKGQCALYDNDGNNHGNMSFKCKSVCSFVVQTFDMIDQNNSQRIQAKTDQLKLQNNPQHDILIQKREYIDQKAIQQAIKQQKIRKQEEQRKKYILQQQRILEQEAQRQKQIQEEQLRQKQAQQQKLRAQQQNRKLKIQQMQKKKKTEQQMINSQIKKREMLKQNMKKMQLKKYSSIQLVIKPSKPQSQLGNSMPLQAHLHQQPKFRQFTTLSGPNYKPQGRNDQYFPISMARSPKLQKNQVHLYEQQQLSNDISQIPNFDFDKIERKNIRQSMTTENDIIYNQLNQTQSSKISKQKKQKIINFKISSIDLYLQNPNVYGKIIRMKIGHSVYHTQTSKQYCFLNWKGVGYFFPHVQKNSILQLQLLQQKQGVNRTIASCRIHLYLLNTSQCNRTFSSEQNMRDQYQSSIGRITINYEILQKRSRSLQSNLGNQIKQIQTSRFLSNRLNQASRETITQKKKKKKKSDFRISTETSKAQQLKSQRNANKKIHNNLGSNQYSLHQSIFSRLRSKPPVTRRKYTGGNIVIPKAHRFSQKPYLNFAGDPGPGSYQVNSSFDRHASPL